MRRPLSSPSAGDGATRFGPGYEVACLQPFAEQLGRWLVERLPAARRAVVGDLVCDRGAMMLGLQRALPAASRIVAVDTEESCLEATRRRHRGGATTVVTRLAGRDCAGLGADCWGAAVSLFTAGFAPAAVTAALDHVPGGGRVGLLAWFEPGALHERLLAEAIDEVAGCRPPFFDSLFSAPTGAGMVWGRVRDVVRFDSITHYWTAMVDERLLGVELEELAPGSGRSILARCRDTLARYTAADGTLRIPVEAIIHSR